MDTLKELFKIGSGPSSSHTMGPQRAAERFKNENPDAESFRAILYGSLAATGKGHLTDYIIEKTIAPKKVEIVWEEDIIKDFHPNGMKFEALDKDKNVTAEWTVYSVGGGTIAEEGQRNSKSNSIYHLDTMDEIVKWCKENNKTLVDFVLECEPKDIKDYIKTIKDAKKAGLDVCVGGIIGMNESEEQRLKMAFEIRELNVKSFPINILNPIKNTPMENYDVLEPMEILKTTAVFRFIIPNVYIRYAGGRLSLKGYDKVGFNGGVNSAIVGDYLTTVGSGIENDKKMIIEQGFEL